MPNKASAQTKSGGRTTRRKGKGRKPRSSMAELLCSQGKRGNPRDYVVLSQHRVIQDGVHIREMLEPLATIPAAPTVVHKSQLEAYVGEEIATDYWHKSIGRRVVRHAR